MSTEKQYKDIMVFSEVRDGELQEVTLELLGKARDMADASGQRVCALLPGRGVSSYADTLIACGADKVIVVESNVLEKYRNRYYADMLEGVVEKYKPSILLFGATSTGRDLAPRLANRIKTGLSADCINLEIDSEGILIQTKPSFGGNIMVEITCPEKRPQMATVRPKVLKTPEEDASREGEVIREEISLEEGKYLTRVIELLKDAKSDQGLEKAEIVLIGGRGMQTKENFDELYKLADILGASVGGTRPAVREGWIEESLQIGQSGKTIAPKLIFNFGVSGAVQYTVGVQNADMSISVNKDAGAAIFNYSDYGIVGDASEVVGILIEQFKQLM